MSVANACDVKRTASAVIAFPAASRPVAAERNFLPLRLMQFFAMLALLGTSAVVLAAPIDLSSWSEEGPGGGVWTVGGSGVTVNQSVNSPTPTFFISDDPFINKTFTGTLSVDGVGDNDFIGFVFGYKMPFSAAGDATTDFDYLLFDWKQEDQATATEGFYLSEVSGDFSDNSISHGNLTASNPFWSHVDNTDANSDFTVLASDIGPGRGWADLTTYTFELTYQTDLVEIAVDGGAFVDETIFSVAGSYTAGSFGFYNFSQANVTYSGFEEEEAPVPEPTTLVLMGLGLAGLGFTRRRKLH